MHLVKANTTLFAKEKIFDQDEGQGADRKKQADLKKIIRSKKNIRLKKKKRPTKSKISIKKSKPVKKQQTDSQKKKPIKITEKNLIETIEKTENTSRKKQRMTLRRRTIKQKVQIEHFWGILHDEDQKGEEKKRERKLKNQQDEAFFPHKTKI